jgi:hypothetical protein
MKIKTTIERMVLLAALLLLAGSHAACTKVLAHGRDKDYDPATKSFSASTDGAYKAGKEALIRLGYKIETEDEKTNTIVTNWTSAKATSHYVDLFDHRDYGTVGAYYRLKLEVTEGVGGHTLVAVSAPTRSLITGRLRTSYNEENKVLKKIADLLRTDDFEMTNVGVTEK